jgi:hypothetical protein
MTWRERLPAPERLCLTNHPPPRLTRLVVPDLGLIVVVTPASLKVSLVFIPRLALQLRFRQMPGPTLTRRLKESVLIAPPRPICRLSVSMTQPLVYGKPCRGLQGHDRPSRVTKLDDGAGVER